MKHIVHIGKGRLNGQRDVKINGQHLKSSHRNYTIENEHFIHLPQIPNQSCGKDTRRKHLDMKQLLLHSRINWTLSTVISLG